MKIYLLRHGEATHSSSSGKDFDRPLSAYGKQQIGAVEDFLVKEAKGIELSIYCSNALRTKETLRILYASLKIKKSNFFDELYHADFEFLIRFLKKISPSEENVLLVGHNNGISDLASYLLDKRIGLPTGGLLKINFELIDNWKEIGRGTGEEKERFYPIIE